MGIREAETGEMGEDRTHPWDAGERWGELRWWEPGTGAIRDAHNVGDPGQAGTQAQTGEQGQGRQDGQRTETDSE